MGFWTVILILGGVWLFFTYPRQAIIGIGCIIGFSCCVYLFFEAKDESSRKEKEKASIAEAIILNNIEINVYYSVANCSKEYPLLVMYDNQTDNIIYYTGFKLSAYMKGYSNNVIKTYPSTNENFISHKIINPKKIEIMCFSLPQFNERVDPKTLSYKHSKNRALQN